MQNVNKSSHVVQAKKILHVGPGEQTILTKYCEDLKLNKL
jgi:hypothetical protein